MDNFGTSHGLELGIHSSACPSSYTGAHPNTYSSFGSRLKPSAHCPSPNSKSKSVVADTLSLEKISFNAESGSDSLGIEALSSRELISVEQTLPCCFYRVKKGTRLAIVAQLKVYFDEDISDLFTVFQPHVSELNTRLPLLKVESLMPVEAGCFLMFQGWSWGTVTPDRMAAFLRRITNDLSLFLAYAQIHSLPLRQNWHRPPQLTRPKALDNKINRQYELDNKP